MAIIKFNNFDLSKAAEKVCDDQKEYDEKQKDIEEARKVISELKSSDAEELDSFLKEMDDYISNFEKIQKRYEKHIKDSATNIMESLEDQWQHISNSLETLKPIGGTERTLQDQKDQTEWIESFLQQKGIIDNAMQELGESLHETVASTMEYLNSQDDEVNALFSKTDALQSAITVSIISACLTAAYIAKKVRGKNYDSN